MHGKIVIYNYEKTMEVQILARPPLSGEYEEHQFDAIGNTIWIKFLDSKYIEWCGVFGLGWKPSESEVKIKPNTNLCYVLAGGQIYIVDINSRKLVTKFKADDIESFLFHEQSGFLVATDGLRLILFQEEQEIWSSNLISIDGIKLIKQNGNIVEGKLNDMTSEWSEFSFNVEERTITNWIFDENLT